LGIYPGTKSTFLGPKNFKDRQKTGQDRINVAMEMILNHNGSSKSYRDSRINDGLPVASVDVYSKIIQEYSNRESLSTDWYHTVNT
jgi:hypothetical protein